MARLRDRPELRKRDLMAERVQTDVGRAFMADIDRARRSVTLDDLERALEGGVASAQALVEQMPLGESLAEALADAVLEGGKLAEEDVEGVAG